MVVPIVQMVQIMKIARSNPPRRCLEWGAIRWVAPFFIFISFLYLHISRFGRTCIDLYR